MIDREKPRVLREIPVGTIILDPTLIVNMTSSEVIVLLNRDLADRNAPTKVTLKPDQYYDLPHMNYNVYRDDLPGEKAHVQMLKGRTRESWLKRIPRRFTEGRTDSGEIQ